MVIDQERRQFFRAEVQWPARIVPSNRPAPAEIKSISQAGASMYCQQLPRAGREFRLEIQPPNRRSIIVSARQIWAIETGSAKICYRFVCGVQFHYISEEDVQFLGDTAAQQKSPKERDKA